MKTVFDISLRQASQLANIEDSFQYFKNFLSTSKILAIQKLKKVTYEDGRVLASIDDLVDTDAESYIYNVYYTNLDVTLIVNKSKKVFTTMFFLKKTFATDDIYKFIQELLEFYPDSDITANSSSTKVYKVLYSKLKYDEDTWSYYYVGQTSWLSVYSSRNSQFLKMPDSFYENIPAYKVEKLKTGGYLVQVFENPFGETEKEALAIKKVIEYYKEELTKLGFWGVIRDRTNWGEDWRIVHKTLIESKGLKV